MKPKDDTTLRLDETEGVRARAAVTGVRWFLPDGRATFSLFEHQQHSLGRGAAEAIRLDASGVSRSHAEVVRQGPIFAIHDLGSTNGTYVNGQRIEHNALSAGDVLRLGDAVGVVVRCATEHADAATQLQSDVIFGPGLAPLLATLRSAAPTDLPVVIEGETGTGKECIARTLHALSGRKGPFYAVNCAALPPGLAEAELFGHRKGAFTGAEQAGTGHFRAAQGGTLFLDELVELDPAIQAKLLRVIQQREVTPLGETRSHALDVRVLTAVQRPLSALVAEKHLREDLAMRLRGVVLSLPPLRERREDIAILLRSFLERYSGGRPPWIEARLLEALLAYEWPGNVRELELVTRQLLALHSHEPTLRRSMLPPGLDRGTETTSVLPTSGERGARTRQAHDLQRLNDELKKNGGKVSRAAATVGVSRQRAYRLLGTRTETER